MATEQEARAMDKEVVRIVGEIRSNWLRLGSLIQKMIDTRAFEALGFPNMHSWVTARLGESISNAFSALRSVRALKGVPEEKLKRIGERNAHMLTYLPEKERRSEEWLEKGSFASYQGIQTRGRDGTRPENWPATRQVQDVVDCPARGGLPKHVRGGEEVGLVTWDRHRNQAGESNSGMGSP
jgi:hypothetical protein